MWSPYARSWRVTRKMVPCSWRPFVVSWNFRLENYEPFVKNRQDLIQRAMFEFYAEVEQRAAELLETGNPDVEIHFIATLTAVLYCDGVVVGIVNRSAACQPQRCRLTLART